MTDSTFDESDEVTGPPGPLPPETPLEPQPLSAAEEKPEMAEWLVDSDFEEPEHDEAVLEHRPPQLPGPGLLEAGLWIIGVFVAQIVGAMIVVFGLMVEIVATEGMEGMPTTAEQIEAFLVQNVVLFIGGSLALPFVLTPFATRLRLGSDVIRRLSLRPVSVRHLVPTVLLVLPMALLSGQIAWWMQQILGADAKGGQQMFNPIEELVKQAPLPILILIIAVVPAIYEELIFRGVIGRGLLARRGLVVGVLLTSLMFAMVHLMPAQVVALIPLSISLHLLYLATRTFWIPMLVHFLNNALAAVVMKFPPPEAVKGIGEDGPLSLPLLLSVVACVIFVIHYIWRTRVEFALPDGTWWNPGYTTAEAPPASLMTVARHRSVAVVPGLLAMLALAAFYGSLGLQMMAANQ
jgi:membrane protease YdiL (CAAX protease family)